MKLLLTSLFFAIFLNQVFAQPEINCDTIHIDPSLSEYVLPYPIGETFTVTQSNCFPNGGHNLTFAYDFNTTMGDTIVASRPGVVTFVNDQYADTDWVSGHENNVFVGHSDGSRIRYTHLMQGGVLVGVGQNVVQGQPIGLSGNSGNTGGFPHLHLSAFRDNTSFNRQNTIPINFCNALGPVNNQNLLIGGQSYTAIEKIPTGIDELEWSQHVHISPNPASSMLNITIPFIQTEFIEVQILTLTGQSVYKSKLSNDEFMIDLSGFTKGLYFVVVNSANQKAIKRLSVL